jgi:hypothetical protein
MDNYKKIFWTLTSSMLKRLALYSKKVTAYLKISGMPIAHKKTIHLVKADKQDIESGWAEFCEEIKITIASAECVLDSVSVDLPFENKVTQLKGNTMNRFKNLSNLSSVIRPANQLGMNEEIVPGSASDIEYKMLDRVLKHIMFMDKLEMLLQLIAVIGGIIVILYSIKSNVPNLSWTGITSILGSFIYGKFSKSKRKETKDE